MKKVLSVLVAAIMLAALCVPAFAAGEAVTLTADKTALKAGETVTVNVNITNLSGVTAEVHFDTDVFELVKTEDTELLNLEANEQTSYVRFASAGKKIKTGTILKIELKYKGGDGKITLDVEDALAGGDETLTALCGTAVKTLTITEKASEATTAKKPAEQTTKKPAATTKAPSKGNVSKVNNPKSGGTVSVAASAAAVVVMAAAVAYTMKKKNED